MFQPRVHLVIPRRRRLAKVDAIENDTGSSDEEEHDEEHDEEEPERAVERVCVRGEGVGGNDIDPDWEGRGGGVGRHVGMFGWMVRCGQQLRRKRERRPTESRGERWTGVGMNENENENGERERRLRQTAADCGSHGPV